MDFIEMLISQGNNLSQKFSSNRSSKPKVKVVGEVVVQGLLDEELLVLEQFRSQEAAFVTARWELLQEQKLQEVVGQA